MADPAMCCLQTGARASLGEAMRTMSGYDDSAFSTKSRHDNRMERNGRKMRTVGVTTLGVFIGFLAGVAVFHELLSRLLVAAGADIGAPLGLVIAFGPIVLAVIGAVVAVLINQRLRMKRARS